MGNSSCQHKTYLSISKNDKLMEKCQHAVHTVVDVSSLLLPLHIPSIFINSWDHPLKEREKKSLLPALLHVLFPRRAGQGGHLFSVTGACFFSEELSALKAIWPLFWSSNIAQTASGNRTRGVLKVTGLLSACDVISHHPHHSFLLFLIIVFCACHFGSPWTLSIIL